MPRNKPIHHHGDGPKDKPGKADKPKILPAGAAKPPERGIVSDPDVDRTRPPARVPESEGPADVN
jgi:hypothetical protein